MSQKWIEELPFVAHQGGTVTSCWAPERTGTYARDCQTGRRYADALVRYLQAGGQPQVVPWIAQALPAGSEFTGVEIGFMTRIADALRGAAFALA